MSSNLSPCPVCGGTLTHARQLTLCGTCHGNILATGTAKVSATGEFAALNMETAAAVLDAPPPNLRTGAPVLACTWCSKPREQVKKLLQGNQVSICNECVALCSDIMAAELGSDWR